MRRHFPAIVSIDIAVLCKKSKAEGNLYSGDEKDFLWRAPLGLWGGPSGPSRAGAPGWERQKVAGVVDAFCSYFLAVVGAAIKFPKNNAFLFYLCERVV